MFSRLKCTYSQIDKLTASYHSASIWFSVRRVQTSSCLRSFVINEVLGKRFAVIIESGIGNLVKKWNIHDISRSSERVAADNNFWNFFVLDGNLNSLCFSLSLRRNVFCNVPRYWHLTGNQAFDRKTYKCVHSKICNFETRLTDERRLSRRLNGSFRFDFTEYKQNLDTQRRYLEIPKRTSRRLEMVTSRCFDAA